MSQVRTRRRFGAVFQTTAVRLSALYLLLFSVCAIVLIFYMTSLAAGFFMSETRQAIEQEVRSLDRVYQRGGMRGLVVAIDRRSRAPGAFVYLVADQTGRILAGNVRSLEPGVLDKQGQLVTDLDPAYAAWALGAVGIVVVCIAAWVLRGMFRSPSRKR